MKSKARAIIRLIRPGTTLSGVLATVLGGYVTNTVDWSSIFFAALAVLCIQGAGNTINDVFDREIDRTNKPWRPIPRGDISHRQAAVLAGLLFCIGNIISLLLGPVLFIIALLVTFILLLYAARMKCTVFLSNLIVASASALVPVFGAASVGDWKAGLPLAVVVFCGILARELLKDLADIDGDAQSNCQKTAVVIGKKRTLILFEVLAVGTIAAILAPTLKYGTLYGALALIPVVGTIFVMIYVRQNRSADQLEKMSNLMKMFFFIWFMVVVVGA